jgi:DnaK suppressor protein
MTTAARRLAALKEMLLDRRRELLGGVQSRIRSNRRSRAPEGQDGLEFSEAEVQADIEIRLIQMQATTVKRIDEALVRLEAGQYGTCVECERAIAATRLRVLPFAVCCRTCEGRREDRHRTADPLAAPGNAGPFAGRLGF